MAISKSQLGIGKKEEFIFTKWVNTHLLEFEKTGKGVYVPRQSYKIDLTLSENPLGAAKNVTEFIKNFDCSLSHYPDPFYSELRDQIQTDLNVRKDHIIFGAGVDGLIENIVRVLISPGDEVVVPDLCFPNVTYVTMIMGGEVKYGRMKKNFHVDFPALKRKITNKTKFVMICNPNNPTGLTESKQDILDFVKSTNVFVIVDEANIDFGGESVAQEVMNYKNLIVLRSFSKGYGLAGLRMGYMLAVPDIIYYTWRLRPPFPNAALSYGAALQALKNKEHIRLSRDYVCLERQYLEQALSEIGFEIVPSEANCFIMKVTPMFASSTDFINRLNVMNANVVNGKFFRSLRQNYVRIAPRSRSVNEEFIKTVQKVVSENKTSIFSTSHVPASRSRKLAEMGETA